MRFSVVYESEARRWAVVDSLVSDVPMSYFETEWDARGKACDEEWRWRNNQLPRPRTN